MNFKKLFPIIIICFLGAIFHYNHMNDFPSHTHAWAQSDRYAISKSFVNNGLNLFEPETCLLNPQFPDFWETPQKESITSVDFPIHDYIPAVFMKITGIDSPWVVRFYNLLYSFLGLFFLYKLALFYLNNELKALFITIFAATSPVFLFYQNSFIPTIPSLANAIISIYFYAKYSRDNANKNFNIALIFGTLAGLSRFTFVIPLIAILSVEFLQIIRKKSKLSPKIVPVVLSISIFLGYYFYNKYLRSLYGSSFLDTLMNAENWDAFVTKFNLAIDSWGTQYFSAIHYYVALTLILISSIYFVFKKEKTAIELKKFNLFVAVLILGNIFFLIAMVHQFILHDYYFIDSLYLPFVLLLMPILAFIPNPDKKWMTSVYILILICVGYLFTTNGLDSQNERYTYKFWDEGEQVVENYQLADKALTGLGYDMDAKVLIFESFAPNLPLLTMNRKGYAIMAHRVSTIDKALTWDYDVIVIQNEQFISKILPIYPNLFNKMTKIWGNDKITLCKLGKNNLDFNSFFDLNSKELLIESKVDNARTKNESWINITPTLLINAQSDSNAVLLFNKDKGPVFSNKTIDFFVSEKTILFEGEFKLPLEHNASVTISVSNEQGENLYYKVKDLKNLAPKNEDWNTVRLWMNIPTIEGKDLELKLYLTNNKEAPIYLDNLSLLLFETKI